MSYCRHSTDDFHSDVYTYESREGWITHVAANRLIFEEPLPDKVDDNHPDYIKREQEVLRRVQEAERHDINLPFAGTTFKDKNREECLRHLRLLRKVGFHVPQKAINRLEEEITNQQKIP